jgi:hypothetical protein
MIPSRIVVPTAKIKKGDYDSGPTGIKAPLPWNTTLYQQRINSKPHATVQPHRILTKEL